MSNEVNPELNPPALPPTLPPPVGVGAVGVGVEGGDDPGGVTAEQHSTQPPPQQQHFDYQYQPQQQQQQHQPRWNQQLTIPAVEAPPTLSRRQKMARGIISKIDSVYASVHALEILTNLLQDTHGYIETIARDLSKAGVQLTSLKLPCECLQVAIDGLDEHGSIISQAIENSTDTKAFKYAQDKLKKSQTRQYSGPGSEQLKQLSSGVMGRDPKHALTTSLHYAKESLGDILSRTNPDFIDPGRKNKKKKRDRIIGEGVGKTGEEGSPDDDNDDTEAEGGATKKLKTSSSKDNKGGPQINVIDLPELFEGQKRYSPLEMVAYITHVSESIPGSAGQQYVRAYKDKMMTKKLVPVKKSQLNAIVKQYKGHDKPMAPLNWNERGGRELGWDHLLKQFQEKQSNGMSWSLDDTRNALTTAATQSNKQAPTQDVVESHHSSLVAIAQRQNHINEQLQLQEQRLKDNPPKISKQKGNSATTGAKRYVKSYRFDKNDKKYKHIKLPPPADGNLMYTPGEAVANIMNYINQTPKPGRSDIRAYKEKMMAEKLVPIASTQLNELLQRYGGEGKPPAPTTWNRRGREDIISIEELAKRVEESPTVWNIDNTLEVVWSEKKIKWSKMKGIDPSEIKQPDPKTVNAYHTALMSLPSIAHKVVKPIYVKLKPGPKSKKIVVDDERNDMPDFA